MVERSDIRRMLEELRFDEAEQLIADADLDPELRNEIPRRRAEAEERAGALCRHLVSLGEARQFVEFTDLVRDPLTRAQIRLADDDTREQVELYLREAERWEARRRETNSRRLTEARKALDGLDLELARGLMNKIDGRFLSDEENKERDQLLLDISARVMEMESLSDTGGQLMENDRPRDNRGSKQPWWRRWLS